MGKILLIAWACLLFYAFADEKRPSGHPTPSKTQAAAQGDAEGDLDRAFAEFKVAAERLGKSLAKVADQDTAQTRKKVMSKVQSAMLELSHTMDRVTDKIESAPTAKNGSPTPDHTP